MISLTDIQEGEILVLPVAKLVFSLFACVQGSGLSDVEPRGRMGAHWRLDPGAGVRQWAAQEKGTAGPLLRRPPLASLIKSWGRGALGRRRVHCVQGADEVSRGGLGGAWEREDTCPPPPGWRRTPAGAGLRRTLLGMHCSGTRL